ncbi:MAG TPA: hypothetical protein VFE50_23150 [Cyclobacteriaceae bacterium]|nr:hypothetical protein [Cyclobacteriaceae bacterium]
MIVTKELAKQYLIKRAAWFIETAPDGDYMMAYRSVNWLEGMELFEDQDECLRELDKRRTARMESGHCPKCNYRHATETEKDLSYLTLIGEPKGSKIYQCPKCRSGWFTKAGWKIWYGYDEAMLDYVTEWGNRNMQPDASQRKVLNEIGNISSDRKLQLFPAHVVLRDGTEIPSAMIHLQDEPPPPDWFEKSTWHYFDLVKEIRPSEIAYKKQIAKDIMNAMQNGKFKIIYVKDQETQKIYSFESHAGVFFPEELKGKELSLEKAGADINEHLNYYMPHERGGSPFWGLTPPPKTISIRGDKI